MTPLSSEAERLALRLVANGLTADEEEQVSALLRRIPELEAERDQLRAELERRWLPIESAPKDGVPVLVAPGLWNGYSCSVARYDNDKSASKPRPYWSRMDDHGRVTDSRRTPPTHWMPLPPPPTTQEGDK